MIPPGWSVQTDFGSGWTVSTGADPCGQFPGNQTGGSGPYAIVNNFCEGPFSITSLVTPPIDLSANSTAAIQWANDFVDLRSGTFAAVDVSIDGGDDLDTGLAGSRGTCRAPALWSSTSPSRLASANVLARFHYEGFFAYWWQVDDVKVGTFVCRRRSRAASSWERSATRTPARA